MRIVLIPGMGCSTTSNWYSWFEAEMRQRRYITECVLRDFPDQPRCRESVWIPFLMNEIGLDENTIVVGHSSGAACAMRLLESDEVGKLRGAVLVAAAHTDLGDEFERRSEYFNRAWDWEKMKTGADVIHQFHGTDDHLIPVAEGRHVAKMLRGENFEYDELPGKSHFFYPFREILDVVDKRFSVSSA